MGTKFKIYTKTGDDGTSGLIGGTRVAKSDIRLEAYGTIDELNSWIGLVKTEITDRQIADTLYLIQNNLFIIGSHLATDASKSDMRSKLVCKKEDILHLENEIDRMQNELPELTHFILPGGDKSAANTHIARTVCRRSERRITAISDSNELQNEIIVFINRLSDYLFVLARFLNFKKGISETLWDAEKS